MPHIDQNVKLDFKDVLIRPKRSTLRSRAEVDLNRSFPFRNSKMDYTGVPVMAANMDTVGTFQMAKALAEPEFNMFTCIHKHYTLQEWEQFDKSASDEIYSHIAISGGTGDLDRLTEVIKSVPRLKYICLDVANGYSEHFIHFVEKVRRHFPDHTIIAGNVVTPEIVEELILKGADIIKVTFVSTLVFFCSVLLIKSEVKVIDWRMSMTPNLIPFYDLKEIVDNFA